MNAAVNRKDKEAINSAITECVASGFPELDTDVMRARDIMAKLTDSLGKSMFSYNPLLLQEFYESDYWLS